jgi:hypothetical protein
MRFRSDSQRRAVFANMFSRRSNVFSLYFDEFTGDVRSDTIPDVALRLNSELEKRKTV